VSRLRLDVVRVAVAPEIALLLWRRGCSEPSEGLLAHSELPTGWSGHSDGGPFVFDPEAPQRGLEALWIAELSRIGWELEVENPSHCRCGWCPQSPLRRGTESGCDGDIRELTASSKNSIGEARCR